MKTPGAPASPAREALASFIRNTIQHPAWLPSEEWTNAKREAGVVSDERLLEIQARIAKAPEAQVSSALAAAVNAIDALIGGGP